MTPSPLPQPDPALIAANAGLYMALLFSRLHGPLGGRPLEINFTYDGFVVTMAMERRFTLNEFQSIDDALQKPLIRALQIKNEAVLWNGVNLALGMPRDQFSKDYAILKESVTAGITGRHLLDFILLKNVNSTQPGWILAATSEKPLLGDMVVTHQRSEFNIMCRVVTPTSHDDLADDGDSGHSQDNSYKDQPTMH